MLLSKINYINVVELPKTLSYRRFSLHRTYSEFSTDYYFKPCKTSSIFIETRSAENVTNIPKLLIPIKKER